jgi:hypothetical protein
MLTWVIQWLRLTLSNGPNRVCFSHPSPQGANRSSFRNFVFFCVLLECRQWAKSKNTVIDCQNSLKLFILYIHSIILLQWCVAETIKSVQSLLFLLFVPKAADTDIFNLMPVRKWVHISTHDLDSTVLLSLLFQEFTVWPKYKTDCCTAAVRRTRYKYYVINSVNSL